MSKTQKIRPVELYQIRRNDSGDILFVIPAARTISDMTRFELDADDLLLHQQDGNAVRLIELPDQLISTIRRLDSLQVLEIRDLEPVARHAPVNGCVPAQPRTGSRG